MYMTRADSPALQFGQLVLYAEMEVLLVDHGGGDSGLPKIDGHFVASVQRSKMNAPDAEAGMPGHPATHLLWGTPGELRRWRELHPALRMVGRHTWALVDPPPDHSDRDVERHRAGLVDPNAD